MSRVWQDSHESDSLLSDEQGISRLEDRRVVGAVWPVLFFQFSVMTALLLHGHASGLPSSLDLARLQSSVRTSMMIEAEILLLPPLCKMRA